MSEDWVDGTYEAGADDANEPIEPAGDGGAEGDGAEGDGAEGDGAEIGIGEASTFEPEEDSAP